MAHVTFDTFQFVQRLEAAGMERAQAAAIAGAVAEAQDGAELVTKKDLEIALAPLRQEIMAIRGELHREIASIRGELKLHHWMLGAILAGVLAQIIQSFFR